MHATWSTVWKVLLAGCLAVAPASADVVRIEVQSRSRSCWAARRSAPPEPTRSSPGRSSSRSTPRLPANRIVTDLARAPRNAAGKVEFSSDFFLIKPKRIERGNGAVLYEVSNRGGKGMLGFFNHAAGSVDPGSAAEMGDGFLMKQGFTLLWVGWQFDPPKRPGLVRVYPPSASETAARSAAWCGAISWSPNGKPTIRWPIAITPPTPWWTPTRRTT